MTGVIDEFRARLPGNAIIDGARLAARATSYWDASPTAAKCLVRPASTEELSTVMKICHRHGQTVVAQGGRTGIVSGAVATADDVIVSLERMNAIESIDAVDGIAVIQAGAIIADVQRQAASSGLLFPLDFGARGSATIGGATATNAGGLNVLRYGMMRSLVLGLEAVLADGTVVSSLNRMLKNNTGYDLKQLFIGSEGTLGIVTRVVVRLYPECASRQTALLAMESFDAVIRTLQAMRARLAGTLSAFEVMWGRYYREVTAAGTEEPPLGAAHAFYALAEAEGSDADADSGRFEELLGNGLEDGDIADAVLPKSEAERAALWRIREGFDAALPAYQYDVSLPIGKMTTYAGRLRDGLAAWRADADFVAFGHVADGNLHIFVRPYDDGRHRETADRIVYGALDGLSGSVSAEHGIGLDKKRWLASSRSAEEIRLMRQLKAALDPGNLLNPGKVVDVATAGPAPG